MPESYQPDRIDQQIAKLESERRRITDRRKRRQAEADRDEKLSIEIHHQLQRLAVLKLVGVPDAVKLKHAYPPGDKAARLNDKSIISRHSSMSSASEAETFLRPFTGIVISPVVFSGRLVQRSVATHEHGRHDFKSHRPGDARELDVAADLREVWFPGQWVASDAVRFVRHGLLRTICPTLHRFPSFPRPSKSASARPSRSTPVRVPPRRTSPWQNPVGLRPQVPSAAA